MTTDHTTGSTTTRHTAARIKRHAIASGVMLTVAFTLGACDNAKLIKEQTDAAKEGAGHISMGASAGYAREGSDPANLHQLCGSAIAVPGFVPKGKPYTPSQDKGKDFNSGDRKNGWKCLKFKVKTPHYQQYHYTKNGSKVAPKNPKACVKDCYEAGVIQDLDGDGVTAKFVITGHIDPKTQTLKRATKLYIENEKE